MDSNEKGDSSVMDNHRNIIFEKDVIILNSFQNHFASVNDCNIFIIVIQYNLTFQLVAFK